MINFNHIENKIYKDIFTEKEIEIIYSSVKYDDYNLIEKNHQKLFKTDIPNIIVNKIKNLFNDKQLLLEDIGFARYSRDGKNNPSLVPHFDAFKSGRFTLDIQLKSNIDWAIYVEDKKFDLNYNQGLIFSGTHQIHWREPKEFLESDYIDMMFCHFKKINSIDINLEEKITIMEKRNFYLENYYQNIINGLKND